VIVAVLAMVVVVFVVVVLVVGPAVESAATGWVVTGGWCRGGRGGGDGGDGGDRGGGGGGGVGGGHRCGSGHRRTGSISVLYTPDKKDT
jgi:hypothetical protein